MSACPDCGTTPAPVGPCASCAAEDRATLNRQQDEAHQRLKLHETEMTQPQLNARFRSMFGRARPGQPIIGKR